MKLPEMIGKQLLEPDPDPKPQEPEQGHIKIPGFVGSLRPFQSDGVRYMAQRRRVLLGDEMGLGKTIQTLATLQLMDTFPAVVICPSSLKLNWEAETAKWLPKRSVQVLQGNKVGPLGADLIVLNYDVAYEWHRHLLGMRPKALVLDEAHYIKNPEARRSGCIKQLANEIDVRLLLTGTPILNKPEELVSLLALLGAIKGLGGYSWFSQQYCHGGSLKHIYQNKMAQLNKQLRESCYLRREKADVLKELPPKQRTVVPLEIGNRPEYTYQVKHLIKRVKAGEHCLMGGLEQLRLMTGLGKTLAIQNWVDTFLSTGSKLILFAEHTELQRRFMGLWPTAAHVLGEDSMEVRHAQVQRFQTDPECRLIVCSLKAAGVGLTMTAASDVAFAELGWTPAEHDQAEDRAHRMGQYNSVNCWYLLAPRTVDEYAYNLIQSKRSVVNAATSGQEADETPEVVGKRLFAMLQAHAA